MALLNNISRPVSPILRLLITAAYLAMPVKASPAGNDKSSHDPKYHTILTLSADEMTASRTEIPALKVPDFIVFLQKRLENGKPNGEILIDGTPVQYNKVQSLINALEQRDPHDDWQKNIDQVIFELNNSKHAER